MQFLLACTPVLEAVLVTIDADFIDWLIHRHHDLLHCDLVPQLAQYEPEYVEVQGLVKRAEFLHEDVLEVADSFSGKLLPLENLSVLIDLGSGSWGFEASCQGRALEIERPSFTSLELLKAILQHS